MHRDKWVAWYCSRATPFNRKPRPLGRGFFMSFCRSNCEGNFQSHFNFSTSCYLFMRKILSSAAVLLGAMALATSSQAPPEAPEAKAESATVAHEFTARKPAPAKPASQPITQRQVVIQRTDFDPNCFGRFVERPGRRRVKYGKHRWVIV